VHKDVLAILAARYPACFFLAAHERRPLKIGIHKEIALEGITTEELNRAFWTYTSNESYRQALQEGAVRIGLDGAPAGIVTAGEAGHSRYVKRVCKGAAGTAVQSNASEHRTSADQIASLPAPAERAPATVRAEPAQCAPRAAAEPRQDASALEKPEPRTVSPARAAPRADGAPPRAGLADLKRAAQARREAPQASA
jgi:ProP effector